MLSVVINTYNEEKNIAECINSVKGIANEIVVCDMYSSDNTVKIAESLGATIFLHKKEKVVEPARFSAISSARYDWILVLDADERMIPETASRISEAINSGNYDIIYMWSRNYYFGDYVNNGGFYYEIPRCFKKELYVTSYSDDEAKTHMNFSSIQKQCRSPLHLSKEFYYNHLAYDSIEKYVSKTIGYYACVEASDKYREGLKFSKSKLILQPVKTFIKKYFILKGYKDGIRGLVLCVFYSVYEFSKWANVWMLEQQEKARN
ncbi:MAG: glycosyltransferase family 2 protein [Chitinophagaceae bacterium]